MATGEKRGRVTWPSYSFSSRLPPLHQPSSPFPLGNHQCGTSVAITSTLDYRHLLYLLHSPTGLKNTQLSKLVQAMATLFRTALRQQAASVLSNSSRTLADSHRVAALSLRGLATGSMGTRRRLKKGFRDPVNDNTYSIIMDTLIDSSPFIGSTASKKDAEAQFVERSAFGDPSWPALPHSGRSVNISEASDVARAYAQLSAILSRNNVRNELRLQERYEKPNEERRRKKSERHRRRFADMVRKKVQLVRLALPSLLFQTCSGSLTDHGLPFCPPTGHGYQGSGRMIRDCPTLSSRLPCSPPNQLRA